MGVKTHLSLSGMVMLGGLVRLEGRRRALAGLHCEPEPGLIREDEEATTVAPEINRITRAVDGLLNCFL